MNCDELAALLPDLVDGSLAADVRAEAEATLPQCPECQQELEIARQVHTMLLQLQAEHADLRIPAGFESRLLAKVRAQHSGKELFDLSTKTFVLWLLEFIELLGGLIDPQVNGTRAPGSNTAP
jgi:anti-sigma factor RsiW